MCARSESGSQSASLNEAAVVELTESHHNTDGEAQEASHLYGHAEQQLEWLAAILEHQHG
jgi:hypothetical protein